jgi:uncharacterized protein
MSETHSAVVFFAGDRAYKLKKPESVIIDASWMARERREAAAAAAERVSADLVQLHCAAPPGLTAQRMHDRTGDASDADPAIAARMAAARDPWPEAITIDTSGTGSSGSLSEPARPVRRALEAIWPHGPQHVWRRLTHPYMPPD